MIPNWRHASRNTGLTTHPGSPARSCCGGGRRSGVRPGRNGLRSPSVDPTYAMETAMLRCLSAVFVVAVLMSASHADWPVFRGDALMTGVGQAKLPDRLAERWSFKCGDGVEGAPAIVNGTVYVASYDKHLYALELATGRPKWKTKLGAFKASPAVKGDRVYVGDLDGRFYCVNAADGKPVWTFETEGEIHAGPNFHGNNILIGSHDSTLYCLGPDGKKVWEV